MSQNYPCLAIVKLQLVHCVNNHPFSRPIGHSGELYKGANGAGVVVVAMVIHRLVDARLLQVNNVHVRSVLSNHFLAV